MKRVAIGPATHAPSWTWVGAELGEHLRRWFAVSFFASLDELPDADLILFVKALPAAGVLARRGRTRIVYAPVDRFESEAAIEALADVAGSLDLVALHARSLGPSFARLGVRIAFVDHHLKFALDAPVPFRESGYVVWVGGLQHVPHLLFWLERHPVPAEVKIVTDRSNRNAWVAAVALAGAMSLPLRFEPGSINGFQIIEWSEDAQAALLAECRGALDVKGPDFSQRHKPPTKGQQFVASGIPFACNPGNAVVEYFRTVGLDVPCPSDAARWFSRDYFDAVQRARSILLRELSIDAVTAAYRTCFDRLLEGRG